MDFITYFSLLFSSSCNVCNYYLQKQIAVFTFSLRRQVTTALCFLCKILVRVPELLRQRILTVCSASQLHSCLSLSSCCRAPLISDLRSDWAVSPLVCSRLFISLMGTFAFRPLHLSNNIASETAKWQMCPFVSPSFCLPSLGLLQSLPQPVCVAAWLAEELLLTTFLPSFLP